MTYSLKEKPFTIVIFILILLFNLGIFLFPLIYMLIKFLFMGSFNLENFRSVYCDSDFWISLCNSLLYSFISVTLQIVLGLLAAWVFQYYWKYKLSFILLLLLFLPYTIPSAQAILGWKLLIEENGFLSQILTLLFGSRGNYLITKLSLPTLILVSVWQFYPFVFFAMTTALKSLPKELVLNSIIDSPNEFYRFKKFIYPYLKKILVAVATLRLIFMFTKFDTPYLLFGENAKQYIKLLPIYIYDHIKDNEENSTLLGAFSLIIFLIILYYAIIYYKNNIYLKNVKNY